jgi:hypothetical protein
LEPLPLLVAAVVVPALEIQLALALAALAVALMGLLVTTRMALSRETQALPTLAAVVADLFWLTIKAALADPA